MRRKYTLNIEEGKLRRGVVFKIPIVLTFLSFLLFFSSLHVYPEPYWFGVRRVRRNEILYREIWIELTKYCSIDCRHCFAQAKPKSEEGTEIGILSNGVIQKILLFLEKRDVKRICISGGEPTEEIQKVLTLISNANVSEIMLVTNAGWANSLENTQKMMDMFLTAMRTREELGEKPLEKFQLRISIDEFHQERIPLQNIINIIKLFSDNYPDNKYPNIEIGLRGILTNADPVPQLVKELGAESYYIQNPVDKLLKITLSNGFNTIVDYSVLFFVGRGKNLSIDGYERYDFEGDLFNNRRLGVSRGASITITADGDVSLDGHWADVLNFGNIHTTSMDEIEMRVTEDAIARCLREKGYAYLISLANNIAKGMNIELLNKEIFAANSPKEILVKILQNPELAERLRAILDEE